MAADPCADDWGEKLVIERGVLNGGQGQPGLDLVERVSGELERAVEAISQGAVEAVVEILDGVRLDIAEATQNPDIGWEPRPVLGERSLFVKEAWDEGLVESVVKASLEAEKNLPEQRPQADSPVSRNAEFEQWCRQVRDPAIEYSEGRRTIRTVKDEARLEYEIAPLPGGGWAVNWQYGFLGGSKGGASHPWVRLVSREECIKRVVSAAREFFAVRPFDHSQQAAYREMQRRLDGGLFGFIEPEPVRDCPPRPTP